MVEEAHSYKNISAFTLAPDGVGRYCVHDSWLFSVSICNIAIEEPHKHIVNHQPVVHPHDIPAFRVLSFSIFACPVEGS